MRAPEDDRVHVRLLEPCRIRTHRLGRLGAEGIVALDQRHEPRARDGHELHARIECVHELRVAPGAHRALRRQQSDAPVARRLHGRVRFRSDDPDDRNVELLLQLRQRRRGRGVAGVDDELHALALQVGADLAREPLHFVQRARPVGQTRVVTQVDEILVRHRDEALVQDGQAAHARVEHAHRPRIHTAIVSPGYAVHLVRRFLVVFAVALTALAPAGRAAAGDFTQTDTKLTMSDGVRIAVSYFEPQGTPPSSGWPAVVLLHGLGQTRNTSDFVNWSPNLMAQRFFAPDGYAVLTYDARAHGESGGLFTLDGPRELQDLRELLTWLTTKHPVDAQHVGAYGASYGGGLLWRAAVAGLPLAPRAPPGRCGDLRQASPPQGHVRAGILLGFSQDVARGRYGPEELQLLTNAISETNVPALLAYLATP